ncbi:MAG: hypothetical protein Q4C77_01075 [Eubacteriales bacterium]|nr:hypothetical protein [Eubacteriales bacterium]
MKNPKTSGKVKISSVPAGEESNILSPTENINIPGRKMNKNSKILYTSDDGVQGWIKG